MKLVIAEKPSVARDIARVLGAGARSDGSIQGNGWVVTWCIGHLIELEEPDAYDAAWKRWSWETLPMVPERFLLRPVKRTKDQWRVVRELLLRRDFDFVVNACDAGREGELIFRYVYERAKSKLPIKRLWISSLTTEAIERGFRSLADGSDYDELAAAARCRSEADWLVGLNATRAMTLWANGSGVHSIGRVQTPTLALIVERELEIRRFVPRDFWELRARLRDEFDARWTSPEGATRLASEALARQLHDRVKQAAPKTLRVASVTEKDLTERAPQLFDLTSLQQAANHRYGFSADRTLSAAQDLYERYKLITYPRTSSRYLGEDQRGELPGLVRSFLGHPEYGPHADRIAHAPLPITKRIIDDAKVGDHHAIIPTGARATELPDDARKIYDLIVRRFLAAFHPDARFRSTEILLIAGAGGDRPKRDQRDEILETLPPPPDRFVARGRVVIDPGWQAAEPPKKREDQTLPEVRIGEELEATLAIDQGKTQPPRRHTDATLLGAMETAGKLVEDEALREAMKDRGLGTPATRASIIETLIARSYVRREKKMLIPTDKGIELIERLPVPTLRSAELTGEWEARLLRISRGEEPASDFMRDVVAFVREAIDRIRRAKPSERSGTPLGRCPRCGREVIERRSSFECASCPFSIPRYFAGRMLAAEEIEALLTKGKTPRLKGFRSKTKKRFSAALALIEGEVRFSFPEKEKRAAPKAEDGLQALTCPRCRKQGIVSGRKAWGCAHWREGCTFTVPYVFEGKKLTRSELESLLTKGRTRKATFGRKKGRVHLDAGRPTLQLEDA